MDIRHSVRILAAGSLLTLAVAGILALHVQAKQNLAQGTPTPAAPANGTGFALSPEEAVIALLPYKLSADAVPPGYAVGSAFSVFTDLPQLANDSNPAAEFAANQADGLVVGYAQDLVTTAQSVSGSNWAANVDVRLFADSASANAFASGRTMAPVSTGAASFDRITLGETLGDASAAWHFTGAPAGEPPEGYYLVRWQRGQIVFGLNTAIKPVAQERQADVESLAVALDAIEQTRPPLSLGPATVMPPATETQRLQAAIQLESFFTPALGVPDGYSLSAFYFHHPARYTASAPDPATALRALHVWDEQWKWVMRAGQEFTNEENDKLFFRAEAMLCADPQGAAAYAGTGSIAPLTGWTTFNAEPPVRLGDATFVVQSRGPDEDGEPAEGIDMTWTHGALVLEASMFGPTGTTSRDLVASLAQQIEDRFQASALPTNWSNVH